MKDNFVRSFPDILISNFSCLMNNNQASTRFQEP